MLRDPAPPALPEPPPAPVVPVRGRPAAVIPPPPPPPPSPPDLIRLLGDGDVRIRRRAALAVGRVGLADGVAPLVSLLTDAEPEVRQMAAFSIGLIGDRSGGDPLIAALGDPSPFVKGSAAEALGLIGDPSAAGAIAEMAAGILESGGLAQVPAEADDARRDTPASAFRLALVALARLKDFPALAKAALDPAGQPRVWWWPVAYALQSVGDKGARPALLSLLGDPNPYTRAFAAKGLGAVKDRGAVPLLVPLIGAPEHGVAIEAIRALGAIGDAAAGAALIKLVRTPKIDGALRVEALDAAGLTGGEGVDDTLLDALVDPSPPARAAALRGVARRDPENFLTVLSGLDPDQEWTVRASLATLLGTLGPTSLPRLQLMLQDTDQRVIPSVLDALVKLAAPNLGTVLIERLTADDPVVRMAAARGIGELKVPNAGPALVAAFEHAKRDATYLARAAVLAALARVGAAEASPLLEQALADPEWAVRVRAAQLLRELAPESDAAVRIRPVPSRHATAFYQSSELRAPRYSAQVYVETDRGTIQLELAMHEAPLTVANFIALAKGNFFSGLPVHRVVPGFVIQTGDPRGDGEGGPGFTIRDELNQRPFLRGAVGMALDWTDTAGSQFFITLSPQPQLDARYTVFGRVVSGMEIVDQLRPQDIVRRVHILDGDPQK